MFYVKKIFALIIAAAILLTAQNGFAQYESLIVTLSDEGPFGIRHIEEDDAAITVRWEFIGFTGVCKYAIAFESASELDNINDYLEKGSCSGATGSSSTSFRLSTILKEKGHDPSARNIEYEINIYVVIEYEEMGYGYGYSSTKKTTSASKKLVIDLLRPPPPIISQVAPGEKRLHVVFAKTGSSTAALRSLSDEGEEREENTGSPCETDEECEAGYACEENVCVKAPEGNDDDTASPTDAGEEDDGGEEEDTGAAEDAGEQDAGDAGTPDGATSVSGYEDIAKFIAYYRKVDAEGKPLGNADYARYPDSVSFATGAITISGLENDQRYEIVAKSEDEAGNLCNGYSEPAYGTPMEMDDFFELYRKQGGKEKGGFCFIATTAFGDYDAPPVVNLRLFRDKILLQSDIGKKLVAAYYQNGREAARFLEERTALKGATKLALYPISWAAYSLTASPLSAITQLFLLMGLCVCALLRVRKNSK